MYFGFLQRPLLASPLLVTLLLSGCGWGEPNELSREWFIFASDNFPEPVLARISGELRELVFERASPGDLIHFYPGNLGLPSFSLTVPRGTREERWLDEEVLEALRAIEDYSHDRSAVTLSNPSVALVASSLIVHRKTRLPRRVVLVGTAGWGPYRPAPIPLPTASVPLPTTSPFDGTPMVDFYQPFHSAMADFPECAEVLWLNPYYDPDPNPALADPTDCAFVLYIKTKTQLIGSLDAPVSSVLGSVANDSRLRLAAVNTK